MVTGAIVLVLFVGALCAFGAIIAAGPLAACMLSSQISRREEQE